MCLPYFVTIIGNIICNYYVECNVTLYNSMLNLNKPQGKKTLAITLKLKENWLHQCFLLVRFGKSNYIYAPFFSNLSIKTVGPLGKREKWKKENYKRKKRPKNRNNNSYTIIEINQ